MESGSLIEWGLEIPRDYFTKRGEKNVQKKDNYNDSCI